MSFQLSTTLTESLESISVAEPSAYIPSGDGDVTRKRLQPRKCLAELQGSDNTERSETDMENINSDSSTQTAKPSTEQTDETDKENINSDNTDAAQPSTEGTETDKKNSNSDNTEGTETGMENINSDSSTHASTVRTEMETESSDSDLDSDSESEHDYSDYRPAQAEPTVSREKGTKDRGFKRKCMSVDEFKLRENFKERQHLAAEKKRKAEAAAAAAAAAAGGSGRGGSRIGPHAPQSFVKNWDFVQTLGEGAYGEVKLAYNSRTEEAVAVKIINLQGANQEALDDVRKEVCIHRLISHKNIISFYGMRTEGDIQYLFLQYASGGELFDRIDPDVGMPQAEAQKYYRQLIDGLEYLHSKGIAHRDIKPENLLLDEKDELKIADFGLATVFRHHGKWRHLNRLCGSTPYLAPEVITCKPYQAEPADLWSSGVVLVTMLAGELPWDAALPGCKHYVSWRECHIENRPWNKIDNLALCLLRRLLVERPEKRYTVEQIRNNQWFKKDFSADAAQQLSAGPKRKRTRGSEAEQSPSAISSSQPNMMSASDDSDCPGAPQGSTDACDSSAAEGPISFSQPAQSDDLLLSSQLNATQSSQTPMQKLVRRMTRFFCKLPWAEVVQRLGDTFEQLDYSWKQSTSYVLTVQTVDRRQCQLTFKAMVLEMGDHLLVDFRLSKGDGLEFKRHFLRIRELMKTDICKVPSSWPNM
ncbi:serine/threonine-protein kinase Chk1-like [Babylonia areolata]|uniref:serine/threonine-protein kinase Chk1-like n=1 Tax=Babylonia areolata TaxID=304850 RepID=UPI003FD1FDBC